MSIQPQKTYMWADRLTTIGEIAKDLHGREYSCDEGDRCPNWKPHGTELKINWNEEAEENEPAWSYELPIPHESFVIVEDGEPFCRGIIFDIADLPGAP